MSQAAWDRFVRACDSGTPDEIVDALAEAPRCCATCGEPIVGREFEKSYGTICLGCAKAFYSDEDRPSEVSREDR